MIEALRGSLARRAASRAVEVRRPVTMAALPEDRLVLLVLPADDDGQRAAWGMAGHLDLPDTSVIPVVLGDRIGYVPDRFAGGVQTVGDAERDWRRLPRPSVAEALWARRPDVAINLADPRDLAAAMLVGASPAAVRIGRHLPETERFYDVMITGDADPAAAVGRLLARLDPPILPIDPRADTP